MQIEAIEAFVLACKLGSFQATAEQLNISQPAVSKRLAGLEDLLGQRLFDRVGRRLTLTQAGTAWLPHATELLAVLADGRRTLDKLNDTVSGKLYIGLSHHVALHRIPDVLKQYTDAYPNVDLQISFNDSESACREVMAGETEMAVVTLPTPAHPTLVQKPVWDDFMHIYTAPSHPLAQQDKLRASDLSKYPALLPPETSTTFSLIDQKLKENNVRIEDKITSPYLETLRMLAGVGQGWTILPSTMPKDGLVELEIPGMEVRRQLGIVRHPKRSLSNAANAISELLLGHKLD